MWTHAQVRAQGCQEVTGGREQTGSALWGGLAAAGNWFFHNCFPVTCIHSADQQPNTHQLGGERLFFFFAMRRKANR